MQTCRSGTGNDRRRTSPRRGKHSRTLRNWRSSSGCRRTIVRTERVSHSPTCIDPDCTPFLRRTRFRTCRSSSRRSADSRMRPRRRCRRSRDKRSDLRCTRLRWGRCRRSRRSWPCPSSCPRTSRRNRRAGWRTCTARPRSSHPPGTRFHNFRSWTGPSGCCHSSRRPRRSHRLLRGRRRRPQRRRRARAPYPRSIDRCSR
jgi:hypothetical protein